MKRILLPTFLIALSGAATLAQNNRSYQRSSRTVVEQSTGILTPMELAEPYRQLLEISIFARDRGNPPVEAVAQRPQPPNPENYLTFRGVADDGQRIIGFIEDTRDGSQLRVRIDDPLANGKVTDIDSDGLVYQRKDNAAKLVIALGSNLAGVQMNPPGFDASGFFGPSRSSTTMRPVTGPGAGDNSRSTGRTPGRPGRSGGPQSGRRRGGANGSAFAG